MACKNKEEFALYHISCLFEFDFGKKNFRTFIPIYPFSPQIAATFSVSSISALVNAFTILPLTTTFVPPPTLLTNLKPALSILSSASSTLPDKAPVSTFSSLNSALVDTFTILPSTTTLLLSPTPAPGIRLTSIAYM